MKHGRIFKYFLLSICITVAGCSSTNPYQRSESVDIPITKLASEAQKNGSEQLAGDLHGAVAALKDQRREWYESLSTQARVRAFTQIGLLGLTTVAIYSGLKSGVTSDNDKKNLALAGALGFAAYTGSTWYINPTQEAAYLEGIHDLTCSMLNMEPFRMTTSTFAEMSSRQMTLTAAINALDKEVLQSEAVYRYPDGSDLAQAKVRTEAKEALGRARKTLTSSEQLYRQIETSGVSLMRDGDLVFSRVAVRINAGNKDITPPVGLSAGAADVINKFRAVKIDAASEAGTSPKSEDKDESGKKQPVVNPLVTEKPSPPVVASTAKTSSPPSTKTLAVASADELVAQLTARLTQDLELATAKLEKERAEVAKKRKDIDAQADKDSLAAFGKAGEACEKVTPHDCAVLTAANTSISLANKTATLYAARRPLSRQLLAFDEARKTALKNVQCVRGGSSMTISPGEDAAVKAGQVYEITINGAPPFPAVSVSGQASMELVIGKLPNQFVARVLVAGDAKGEINVSISDRGLAREDVKLTLQ